MSDILLSSSLSDKECWRITRTTLFVDPRCRQKRLLTQYANELYDAYENLRDEYVDDPRKYALRTHEHTEVLYAVMSPFLVSAYLNGYRDMADQLGTKLQPSSVDVLRNEANARAHYSAQTMTDTTADRVLAFLDKLKNEDDDIALSDAELWAFSMERSKAATDYEGVRGYQTTSERTLRNFGGGGWGKQWLIDPDVHQRTDECDENEDAGVIALGDKFPSGDYTDPAHLNCGCQVEYVRTR